MRSVRALRAKLSKEINRAFDEIVPEAEKEIAKAYHEASDNYELPTYEPEPKVKDIQVDNFFQVNEEKLKIVITDVKRDMNKARYGAIERAGSQYKELIQKVDVMKQAGNVTLTQAIEAASKDIAKQGLNCIEYKDGTRVNLTTYTELALRTSARRASLTAEGVKRDEWKEYLVVSPTLHSTCDSCQKWQGKILVDDVYASGKPDGKHPLLSEAIKPPSHFLGVNCFVSGTPVLATGVMASSSREYVGEVVTVFISGGKELTVTPNHLILTDKGWVAAGLLKKGDKVVEYTRVEEFTHATSPNDINVPTAIEDVSHSLIKKLSRSTDVMVVRPEDFHGDGANSKVAIVNTYGFLRNKRNTSAVKPLRKRKLVSRMNPPAGLDSPGSLFKVSNRAFTASNSVMSGGSQIRPFTIRKARHSKRISFRKGTELTDTEFSHTFMDGHFTDTKMSCNVLFSHTTLPKRFKLIRGKNNFITTGNSIYLRPQRTEREAFFFSPLFKSAFADANNGCDLFDSLSGKIKLLDVVKVNRISNFSGHVYNLQTNTGWYLANNIITHNCRHPLVTFREGITQIPKASPYDQTKKNYEAEQEQRRIERYIRYYKRLENLGDANAKDSVKEWQKRMREHLKANPQLRRKPEREKLLGI